MKFGASNESRALRKYEEMKNLLELVGGLGIDRLLLGDTDDPHAKLVNVAVKRAKAEYDTYKELYMSSRAGMVRRSLGRSANSLAARQLSSTIDETVSRLESSTRLRGEHSLLSPVAFQPDLSLIPVLKTASLFKGQWSLDLGVVMYSWKSVHNHSSPVELNAVLSTVHTLLAELDLTNQRLFEWWRECHLDKQRQETEIWNDMRAMARKMVFILDYCHDGNRKAELEFDVFEDCAAEGREIAVTIITLVDKYPTEVQQVKPVVETFLPAVFILSGCTADLKLRKPGLLTTLNRALSDLNLYVQTVASSLTAIDHLQSHMVELGIQADFVQRDDSHREADDNILKKFNKIGGNQNHAFSIQELKRLMLDKIDVEREHCGLLGSGTSATVRKHNAQDHSRQYAVKVYRRNDVKCDEERFWNRIIREAEIWIKADHKNINRLLGYCTFDNSTYPALVMDLCDDNLLEFCEVRPLDIGDKLKLAHDVASGLQYLHERAWVHGDLRPDNILVRNSRISDRYIAVLTDFGHADDLGSTFNRISMRTDGQRAPEAYRAPEFFKERLVGTPMVSIDADIYAFGCVFAVIVHGCLLYDQVKEPLWKLKRNGVYPVPLTEIVDPRHRDLLCDLWQAKPTKRPRASSVVDTLTRLGVANNFDNVSQW